MKKNYFKSNITLSSIVEVSKTYYLFLIVLVFFLFSSNTNAQVTITKPNLSITSCSGFPSPYSNLGNIVITENQQTNFTDNGSPLTIILSAPANFEFLASTGTVVVAGGNNLSSPSIVVTASTVTITYTCSNNNKFDTMTISGLQVRAITAASTGNITRTAGTGIINGLVNGTTVASLTSINTTPTITTQPIATSVCTNNTTTFNVVVTGATTYQWRKNGVNLTNIAPYSGVNTATLTITNPNISENLASFDVIVSSSTPCSITSNAAILTVNPTLPASISIAASANPICDGTSVTFTATPTNEGTTPSYQWKLNGTNVGSNATTYTNAGLANGDIVTCELTSNASPCLTGSPATSNAITMTVNPNLPASVNISASVNPICQGTSVTFTATPTNGGTTPAYQWKLNGINVGSNAATYTNAGLANGDIVTCELTSNAICVTGSPALSNEVTMTVNPILPASISILESVNTICAGTSVTFTATPTNGGTTPSYQWKLNGSNVGSNATTYTSTTLANGDIITCELTSNATPCLTGSPATSNTIAMTVNPNLPASVNIGASANPICSGTSVTFTATPINGGTTPVYQWKLNGTNVGVNAATYTNTALTNGDIITCELTSNATPCLTGSPATSNAVAMTVNPFPVSAGLITGTSSVCQGQASVAYSVPAITNATSYTWSYSGTGATITGTTDTVSITFATNATSGNLSVYGVNACGNGLISANYPITVNPLPVAAGIITGTSTVCQGEVSVTYSISAITNASSYFWAYSGTGATISGTTNTTTISFADNATSGNLTVYGVNSCGNGIVSANYAILVNSLPVITGAPVATTVCTNGTTTFSISATGTTTYQWRKNGINLTNTAPYSGVNTATLTVTNPSVAENGAQFDVVLNGATCPVTSDSAVLTVYEKVVINSQPIASQIFCEGNTATITVAATGDGLTYQWYKGATAMADGGTISGANLPTLTITPLVLSDGATYHCEVSGTSPCNSVVSNNSVLNVNQGPVIITPPAITQTICEGNSVSFSVGATVGSLSYQWYKGAVPLSNGGPISGANTATLTINPVSLGDADSDYNCIVNNGCATETKSSELIVNPKPNAVATPATQTICSSNTITTIALSGSVSGTTFNWTRNNTATVTGIAANGSGDISGSLINTTNAAITVTFTITPIANSCPGTAITATVVVNPTPNAVATPAAQTICSASAITTMVLSGNVAGTTFNWTRDNTATVTGIAANGSGNISGSLTNTTSTPITVTFTITPTANGCPGTPTTATVLVNPTPTAVATNATQTICSAGTMTTMALSGSVSGTTYNWTRNNTATVTGIAASGSGNITGILTNTTSAPITVTFTITPTANGCPGTPITTTIIVNPTPNALATPAAQTICSASAITTIALSGNVAGTSFNWTRDNTATVTGIAANGSGNISGSLTNTTSTPITVTFTITPTANGCPGTPTTATVLVNPTPNAVATPSTQTICSANTITTVVLSGNVAGTIYNWTRNNTATVTGIAASGSGNITGILTNTTNAAVTVTFTITPTANSCPGTPITATVLVEAASVGGAVTISQPNVLPVEKTTTVCHKATGTLYLSGYTGTIIRWESSTTGGTSWDAIANTNPTYQYPEILATTIYRAVIQNGTNCAIVFSTSSMINVIPNIKPSPVTATPSTICAGESSVLFSQSGYATSQYIEPGGDFGNSNPANWTVNGSCKTCLSAGASNTFPGPFQLSATNGGTYSGINYTSNNKFAIANGNFNSTLETPTFNTLGLTNASLQFNHSYNLLAGAYATVELSVDGGNSYNIILAQYNGPSTQQPYNLSTVINLDLNQYLGLSNLKVRFNYHGTVGSSWAIDDILIPDVPVNLTTEWVDATTNLVISTSATVTVTPTVTTTYAVTSRLNGCTSFGPEGTTYVTVIVNQKPVITAADTIICSGETSNVPLTSSETGTTFAWTVVQTNVSGASAGSGSAIGQTLTATGTAPGTAVYTITPTAKGCVGPTKTVTITVNPKPVVTLTAASVCSGEPIIVSTAFSTIGTTFTWTVVQTNVTGASAGSGSSIAHTLTAINGLSGTAVYTVTPTANGCIGTPQTVTISVNPKPTAMLGPIQTICRGGTATFSIALTGTPPWNLTYTDGTTPTTVTTSTNPYEFSVSNVTADVTYTLTAMNDSKCSANATNITGSGIVTVLNGTQGLWTGLVSTDWFNCLNWAGGLPSSTVNAVINSGMPRMPVIDPANSPFAATYGNIASAQDLIIGSSASVTMASLSNSDLHISRNWINRGSFIPGIGTVTFNSATLDQVQTINAGIKTNEIFYNLSTNTSNGAKGISVADAFELTVSNALSLLSGDLRLTGEAQLIQNGVNPNPSSGSGKLLIDQQGQKSSFNYNYWSSPVSTDGANYSVSGVLRDGTDVTTYPFAPLPITFGNGGAFADGSLTSPISISNRWIHSYNSPTPELNTEWDDYYLWKRIGSTGVLKIGEGYIMKGTTGIIDFTATQNYVFVGKPNSGTIPLFLPTEQTYLIGNPYPSALDADEFIKDNLKDCAGCRGTSNVFNGALYFWDQFGGGSHYLAEYVGGYAAYSLMASVVAVADNSLGINDGSEGTKTPGRYIPVAQGFLIDAATDPSMLGTVTTINGGTLNFKNSQRAFTRESSGNSVFMKTNVSSKKENTQTDIRPKIKLKFTGASGSNRQIVVGADGSTTTLFDIGYDAPMLEIDGDKIYWEINNGKFVIQAIPNFDTDQQVPLGLTVVNEGEVTIKISSLENIAGTTEIYLHDNLTGMYYDIKNSNFKTYLSVGEYRNRFSLRFTAKTLSVNENNTDDGIIVLYANNYKVLIIQNNLTDTTIEDVSLFNLLGQAISNWNVENEAQTRIQIPIKNVSSGVYVVKLKTTNGDFSKKIIIK